ncbi:helix-turn-helix domain-containing protein [Anaerotignum faecicola]
MDLEKTGELLSRLRKECGMTQKQVAEKLQISDRTVSKWERGAGLPDVSLLKDISALYDVDIEKILDGNLEEKGVEVGNMKRMNFTRCVHCGNIFWSTGGGEISCCGRKLTPLTAQPMDKMHDVKIEEIDNEYFVTFDHEMTKEHYIVFAALVSWDRATVVRLYPEQSGELRLPRQRRGELYLCCNKDGLFRKKL